MMAVPPFSCSCPPRYMSLSLFYSFLGRDEKGNIILLLWNWSIPNHLMETGLLTPRTKAFLEAKKGQCSCSCSSTCVLFLLWSCLRETWRFLVALFFLKVVAAQALTQGNFIKETRERFNELNLWILFAFQIFCPWLKFDRIQTWRWRIYSAEYET